MRQIFSIVALLVYCSVFSQLNVNSNQTISSGSFDGAEISAELRINGNVTFTNTVKLFSGGSLVIVSGTTNIENDLIFEDGGITITIETGAILNVENTSDDGGNSPNIIVNGTFSINNDLKNSGIISGSGSLIAASIDNSGTIFGSTDSNGPSGGCAGGCNDPTLPIELLYFKVVPNESHVDISWASLTELNNDHYTLYRSYDGESFDQIRIIDGAGNSNTLQTYSFRDFPISYGAIYYKLKQTDFDGRYEEFPIKGIIYTKGNKLRQVIYPTILKRGEHVIIQNFWGGLRTLNLKIIDTSGKIIMSPEVDSVDGNLKVEISSLNSGIYLLSGAINGISVQQRFILK